MKEPAYTEWRMAFVEIRAEGFGPNQWIRENTPITIRAGEFTREAQRRIAREYALPLADVRLVVWNR